MSYQVLPPGAKDLLGQRALKWFKGWTPGICSWLRPTIEQMQEAVDRTNARMDSHRFAGFVMRQISHMRELSPSSKKVRNAVVGYVGPSMIEALPRFRTTLFCHGNFISCVFVLWCLCDSWIKM